MPSPECLADSRLSQQDRDPSTPQNAAFAAFCCAQDDTRQGLRRFQQHAGDVVVLRSIADKNVKLAHQTPQ